MGWQIIEGWGMIKRSIKAEKGMEEEEEQQSSRKKKEKEIQRVNSKEERSIPCKSFEKIRHHYCVIAIGEVKEQNERKQQ